MSHPRRLAAAAAASDAIGLLVILGGDAGRLWPIGLALLLSALVAGIAAFVGGIRDRDQAAVAIAVAALLPPLLAALETLALLWAAAHALD